MKIFIVGGGITGLSAAWAAKKKYPHAHITLFEKENRLGGWMRTSREGGFLFEKGPRTFQTGRSPHLLNLIRELNLDLLFSPSQKRYICQKGKLRSVGSFFPGLLPYLLRELFIPPSHVTDESIYDFACRRFSPKIAEKFFDPLTLGIYAGDIRKLSIRSCFPTLYQWEREKGSVVRGLLAAPKREKGLFTVRGGMQKLVDELQNRLSIEFVLNCPVQVIGESHIEVNGKSWSADRVFSALPPAVPARSLWVVNLVFEGDVLRKKGYGYLVPTQEREGLLGVIFDSCLFPEQNIRGETRLTAMVRAEEKEPLGVVLMALERHLGICAAPIYTSTFYAKNAIAQFEVGCQDVEGISVEACVCRGIELGSRTKSGNGSVSDSH